MLHLKNVRGPLAILLVISTLEMTGAPSALAATTCGAYDYKYMGQATPSASWDQAYGDISVASIAVPAGLSNAHEINYLSLTDVEDRCNTDIRSSMNCWIQAGYGEGNVGGYINTKGQEPYMEYSDEYGYNVNWVTTFGLTQDDYVTVYDTGTQDGMGNTLYEAFIQPTTLGAKMIGKAWLYRQSVYVQAYSEGENFSSAACPSIKQYIYFGTNGSGGGGSSAQYDLQIGNSAGTVQAWNISNATNPTTRPPYSYTPLYSRSAFEGYGS